MNSQGQAACEGRLAIVEHVWGRLSTRRLAHHLVQQGVVSTTSAVTAGIVIETVGFRRSMGGLLGPLLGRNAVVDSSWGQAARLPNENVWLGVTNEGVVVCDVGFWSGRPGNVLMRYFPGQLVEIRASGYRATKLLLLRFSDGSSREREIRRFLSVRRVNAALQPWRSAAENGGTGW